MLKHKNKTMSELKEYTLDEVAKHTNNEMLFFLVIIDEARQSGG